MPLTSTRRTYTSDDDARAIYQSTMTYDEMVDHYDASYDVIRDIRCARGRWKPIVAGLTKGKTHGRNGHGDAGCGTTSRRRTSALRQSELSNSQASR